MNLRQLLSEFHGHLEDPRHEMVRPAESIRLLNHAQMTVARLLLNINREWFTTTNTQSAVDTQELYNAPSDMLVPVSVSYNGLVCTRVAVSNLPALDDRGNTNMRPIKDEQHFYYLLKGTLGVVQVGIRPIPNGTENIIITYVQAPPDFNERGSYFGKVTAATSTTVFNDVQVPYAGAASWTGVDDFWNDAEVHFVSGVNYGIRRRVSDFKEDNAAVYGELTVGTAFPNTPGAGDSFELDEVSPIPAHFHNLIPLYAASLHKRDGGELRQMVYNQLEGIRRSLTENLDPQSEDVTQGES